VTHLVVGEVGDDGAVGCFGDGDADCEGHCVDAVDQSLAELGIGGEVGVEVERLLVHRHVTEHLVVAFADGPACRVLDGLAHLELLVVLPGHGRGVARSVQSGAGPGRSRPVRDGAGRRPRRLIASRAVADDMARRSLLFSPGDRPEFMRKAPGSGADVVCFDLEDAVAPGQKQAAREAVHEVLSDPAFDPDCEVTIRVADEAAKDLEAVLGDDPEAVRLDAVMVPKVADAEDVELVADLLAERDAEVPILALVESARGVLNAAAIADSEATDALVFGAEDLAADVGATRTDEGTEVLYAREHVVLAASAAGVDAIDTVYTDYGDSEGLKEDTEFAIELGYDGKMAIHPSQVSVVNDAFTPDPDRVEWAETVLAARDEADAEGKGVFSVDDQMIDAPLIAQAERIVERARAATDDAPDA
jgi:citrate lyase subunit beta/citryl-CoA lyase